VRTIVAGGAARLCERAAGTGVHDPSVLFAAARLRADLGERGANGSALRRAGEEKMMMGLVGFPVACEPRAARRATGNGRAPEAGGGGSYLRLRVGLAGDLEAFLLVGFAAGMDVDFGLGLVAALVWAFAAALAFGLPLANVAW